MLKEIKRIRNLDDLLQYQLKKGSIRFKEDVMITFPLKSNLKIYGKKIIFRENVECFSVNAFKVITVKHIKAISINCSCFKHNTYEVEVIASYQIDPIKNIEDKRKRGIF